uniref:Siglec family like 2 n=1 Tax=Cricetulus griseus TaxID=10029 RepID=A0A8C2MY09_CRIGR
MRWTGFHFRSLPAGLLPPVLVDMKATAVEDSLCSTVPCVFEFPKASPRNLMTVGYRLNETISFHADNSQPRAPTGDLSTEGVEDCILLTQDVLGKENMTYLLYVAPARLLNYSCLLKRTLACSCSFHGIPIPSVQWWVGGNPVSANSTDTILRVITTTLEPWTNSTIHLMWEPEIIRRLRCEGRNRYGAHVSKIFLIPDKSSISSVFLRGLIQGIVYGTIASSLFFFFLVVLA